VSDGHDDGDNAMMVKMVVMIVMVLVMLYNGDKDAQERVMINYPNHPATYLA